jgi:hypothetical protein
MDNETKIVHSPAGAGMMKKGMNWFGFWKDQFSDSLWGKPSKDDQPPVDLVLDHIILDLTGDSIPLDKIQDASVKNAFKKKKRLLRQSNTLLLCRLGIMVRTKRS